MRVNNITNPYCYQQNKPAFKCIKRSSANKPQVTLDHISYYHRADKHYIGISIDKKRRQEGSSTNDCIDVYDSNGQFIKKIPPSSEEWYKIFGLKKNLYDVSDFGDGQTYTFDINGL